MKRCVVVVALLMAATACNESKASSQTTGPSTTTITSPIPDTTVATATSAAAPALRTVLTVGDGVMFDEQPALAAALAPARQLGDAYFGSGLTRPEQYDWEQQWSQLVAKEHPDVVTVLTGVWDARPTIEVGGQTLAIGTPEWVQYYKGRVARAVEVLSAGGGTVAWVLPLSESDADKSGRLAIVDQTIRDTVAGDPRVVVIDGDRLLSGTPDRFLARGPDGSPLRKTDGEHLCPAGAAALAQGVRDALQGRFALPPAWDRTGRWTQDDRYRNPTEGCTS